MKRRIIYDDLSDEYEDNYELAELDFDMWFDNSYAKQQYILIGTVELWTGAVDGHDNRVANSIKEAIQNAIDGFGICYIEVYEENYGRLFVRVCHHDGSNLLEIREVTKLGAELLDKYHDVDKIVNRQGATRNVRFTKRYY